MSDWRVVPDSWRDRRAYDSEGISFTPCMWARSTRTPKNCTKKAVASFTMSDGSLVNLCEKHLGRHVAVSAKFGDSQYSNLNGSSIIPLMED